MTDHLARLLLEHMDGDYLLGCGRSVGNEGGDVPIDRARASEVAAWAVAAFQEMLDEVDALRTLVAMGAPPASTSDDMGADYVHVALAEGERLVVSLREGGSIGPRLMTGQIRNGVLGVKSGTRVTSGVDQLVPPPPDMPASLPDPVVPDTGGYRP